MAYSSSTTKTTFTRMDQSTEQDWSILMRMMTSHAEATLADRILEQLAHLDGDHVGYAVDRLTHCLQTAERAERDGRDEEYLLCALLHDIGDVLAPFNHDQIAAAILKPYVSQANHWMVAHHGIVQGYYFWHHIGADRNARDAISDHEHYERTVEFCAKYDMLAFDPDYPTPPLSYYEPLIRSAFGPGNQPDN